MQATWDIRSGNRPVVYDEGGFLAKACEMRVQSTRSILRMRSDHAPIFTKKRFYLCCVFPSIKQRVSFCLHALQEHVLRWMKPPTTPLVIGALADLTRGKAELLAENALLRHQLLILHRQVKRPAYPKRDRLLLVLLARMVRTWKEALFLVQPETLLRLPS